MVKAVAALFMHLLTAPVTSETVDVRGRGVVNLRTFECRDITRSTILQRVCYEPAQNHLIVSISNVHDQYCELPRPAFDGLMAAPSMGQFFNRNIRSGPYDCRAQ